MIIFYYFRAAVFDGETRIIIIVNTLQDDGDRIRDRDGNCNNIIIIYCLVFP